jgi:putative phosphoribosyl transferase
VPFTDRREAGRRLAEALGFLATAAPVVVGLPRGGVPVAYEIARALGAPLEVVIVRKLGAPHRPELAMGAVGENGVLVLDDETARLATSEQLAEVMRRERIEVERRAARFRGSRPARPLAGRVVVLVDDGAATGASARAACRVVRALGARRVVLAVPVAPPGLAGVLRRDADEVVCLEEPPRFLGVSAHYGDFAQTTDAEVADLLERSQSPE